MINKGEHVLLRANGREYFTVAGEGKLHTDLGIVDLGAIEGKSWGDTVQSHNANEFTIIKPRAPDLFRHLKRTGAPMMPKDIGTIIAYTGLCPTDTVLDAGTGSGILAAYLGTIAGKVISYEANETFATNARKNMERAGIGNVEVRHGDIVEAAKTLDADGPFDVITLDMQEAAKVVPDAFRLLRASRRQYTRPPGAGHGNPFCSGKRGLRGVHDCHRQRAGARGRQARHPAVYEGRAYRFHHDCTEIVEAVKFF